MRIGGIMVCVSGNNNLFLTLLNIIISIIKLHKTYDLYKYPITRSHSCSSKNIYASYYSTLSFIHPIYIKYLPIHHYIQKHHQYCLSDTSMHACVSACEEGV